MPLESWIQHSRVNEFLYDWQTVIAGVLALVAAFGTVLGTMIIANRQIAASREEADRVIAATREQTEATVKQTEATVSLEQLRDSNEALSFLAMLAAAMMRVIAEAASARKTHPQAFRQTSAAEVSVEAARVRHCITKGAFAELRAACVRRGGSLTREFLDLEGEIDKFASQVGTYAFSGAAAMPVTKGYHAGLSDQLALIETKAAELRDKAVEQFQ
jgi:hypothetical protein